MEADFFKKNKNQIIKIAIFSIIVLILYRLITNLPVTMEVIGRFLYIMRPFIWGGILAYLLYFPCNYLEKKAFKKIKSSKFSRLLSIIIVYLLFFVFLVVLLAYLIPVIITSATEIIKNIPEYIESLKNLVHNIPDESFLAYFKVDIILNKLEMLTSENLQIEIVKYFNLERILGYTLHAVGFVKSLVQLIVTFVVSIYILFDRENLTRYLKKFLKARTKKKTYVKTLKLVRETNNIFRKYIVSQFTDAFVVGIIMTIALLLLKVKYAIFFGFLIGLFNLIPFFGALVAGIVATMLTIITGGPELAIKTGLVILVLQQIDANIIQPKIVGTNLKISRIIVISATTLGGAYFGVSGMFFGVPVLATIKFMIDSATNSRIKKTKMTRLLNKRSLIKIKKPDKNTIKRIKIKNQIYI